MRNHLLRFLQILVLLAAALLAPSIRPGSGRISAAGSPQSPLTHIASAPNATAISAPAVELVGSFGGALTTLAISGTLAYVGEGAGLSIVDVGNPDLPVRLVRMMLPGARQVRLSGNLACVIYGSQLAIYGSQLAILDISVPNNPVSLGSYTLPIAPNDFQIAGKLVYIVYRNELSSFNTPIEGGLEILDISDPAHPALRGGYRANSWPSSIAVTNGYAYVTTTSGLQIIDVQNPAHPMLRSEYIHLPYTNSYVQIEDNLAYVLSFGTLQRGVPGYNLDILDISDPSKPKLRGKSSGFGYIEGQFQVSGAQVYIYKADCTPTCVLGLVVIDASDPAYLITSVLEGVPIDLGYFQDFKVNGSRLYIATKDKLGLFDLIGKNTVAPRGAYTVSTARVDAVQVMEQRAYVLGSSGLEIIDVSDPSSPGLLGRIPAGVTDLSIHNQFAYVIDGPQMQIFDVSDPSNPTLRGTFAVSDTLHAIDINNNFAYLVSGENLSIVDVGNAAAPMLRGTFALTHGTGQAIQVDGLFAYLATFENLDIVDVSDPLSPKIQSSIQAPQAQSVYVAGDRLYTANGQYGLQIFDISVPTAPLLRAHKLWANTSYVRAAGDLLYTASSYGVQIIDVHDPADPLPRATFTTIDHPRRIQVVGDLVFVADGDGGLLILRVHPERFPEPMFLPVIGH